MSTWARGLESISTRRPIDVRPMLNEAFGRKLQPAAFVHGMASGIFHTPGTQAAKIAELNGWIDSFIADVHAHRVPEQLQASWQSWASQVAQWVEQWRQFVTDTDYVDRMWTDTLDQVDRYEVRLCQLLEEFRNRWGGRSTMPAPPPCAASSGPGSFWKTVGIGVLVSLTAAGVLYLVKRGFAPPAATPVVLVAPSAGVDDV